MPSERQMTEAEATAVAAELAHVTPTAIDVRSAEAMRLLQARRNVVLPYRVPSQWRATGCGRRSARR